MSDRDRVIGEALALRAWAEATGVFGQARIAPPRLDGTAAGSVFAAEAAAALVAKPITAVGIAASGRREPRIFVYTRRRLTLGEQKRLRDNAFATPLEFRVARPFAVTTPTVAARPPIATGDDRLPCGSSIGVGNAREAGTLGALLADRDGTLFGLSCNHVTGGCSNARPGLPIVAPGILDVGADAPWPRTIGLHVRALPLVPGDPSAVAGHRDNTDAACFRILEPDRVSSRQGDAYDTPSLAAEPEEDATVEKVGRTTGTTRGIVESRLVGPQRIDYDVVVHHSAEEDVAFRGSVHFEPIYLVRGLDGGFAAAGDSGALVVAREPDRPPSAAVGLVIGGRGGEETWMVPLPPLIARLGLTLVSGHGPHD